MIEHLHYTGFLSENGGEYQFDPTLPKIQWNVMALKFKYTQNGSWMEN